MIDFEQEHREVLNEAMEVYKKRSEVRGQMWLEWPPSDKIRELRERVMRIESAYANRERMIEHGHTALNLSSAIEEDCIDVINYTAFLVKQVRRGMSG
jgi:pimeloyl-CoA synthetase